MATATLKPTALSSIVTPAASWTTSSGTMANSYQLIDDISSDSDYIVVDDTQASYQWVVYDISGSLPADFVGADSGTTYTVRVRTYQTGYDNDITTLGVYLIGPSSTVTQGSVSGLDQWGGSNGFNFSPRLDSGTYPSSVTTSTYSGSVLPSGESASTSDWNNAKIAIYYSKNNQMGSDATNAYVTAVEVDIIDYVQSIATLSSPTTTSIGINSATVGCTTTIGSGTLYAYVSTSATPPSAANLKAGTGAVWSGNQTPSVGANTFNATGLTGLTNYYTHFIQNTAGGDSNILSSSQWTTLDPDRTVTCSTEALRITANDATIEITIPISLDFSSAVAGDELIAVLQGYASSAVPPFFNAPAGWTSRGHTFVSNVGLSIFTKTATGSEGLETFGFLGSYTPDGSPIIIPGVFLESAVLGAVAEDITLTARIGFISAQSQPTTRPALLIKGLTTIGGATQYDVNGLVWHSEDGWITTYIDETDGVLLDGAATRYAYTFTGSIRTLDGRPVFVLENSNGNAVEQHVATSGSTPTDYRYTGGFYAGSARTYNYHYNGTSWTSDTVISDSRYQHASSGTAAASLIAGGANSTSGTSVETWNDVSWTTETSLSTSRTSAPRAQGTQSDTLVECGTQTTSDTEEWNGTAWSTGGAVSADSLFHYAAGGASAAIKSGGYTTGTTVASYVTESYNGTSWATETSTPWGGYAGAGAGSTTDFWTIAGAAISGTEFSPGFAGLAHYVYSFDGTSWASENRHPQSEHDNLSAAGASGSSMATHGGGGRSTYDEYYVAQTSGSGSLSIEPRMEASVALGYHTWEIAYEANTNTILVPPPAEISITGQIPDFRSRKFKRHTRGLKPQWGRMNVQGLAPNFLNTEDSPVTDRTVNCTTETLSVTANAATIRRDLSIVATTEQLTVTASTATVGRGVTVTGGTEALLVATQQALIQTDRDVAATTEQLALGAQQALIARDRAVFGVTEALALTANQATISLTSGLEIVTETEQLLLTPNTGAVDRGRNVGSATEALVVAASTATIQKDNLTTGITEELVIAASASVATDRIVTGSTEALVLTPNSAEIRTDREVDSITEQLVLTANAATTATDRVVTAATEQLVVAASTATIQKDRSVVGVTEALALAASGAQVFRGLDRDVNGSTEVLVSSTTTATIQRDRLATGATAALLVTANQAAVSGGREVFGVTEELVLAANAAQIGTGRSVAGTTEALVLTPAAATVQTDRVVTGSTEALILTSFPAAIFTGINRTVVGFTEELVVVSTAATVDLGRNVLGTTEALLLTPALATVRRDRLAAAVSEALLLTASQATILKINAGAIEAPTIELILAAARAQVTKMTIVNPLPDYRNIGVTLVVDNIPGVIVRSED